MVHVGNIVVNDPSHSLDDYWGIAVAIMVDVVAAAADADSKEILVVAAAVAVVMEIVLTRMQLAAVALCSLSIVDAKLVAVSVNSMDSVNYRCNRLDLSFQIMCSNQLVACCSGMELLLDPFERIFSAQHQAFSLKCLLRWRSSLLSPFAVLVFPLC